MPELPEVEVLARHLTPLLQNRKVQRVEVRRAKIVAPTTLDEFSSGMDADAFADVVITSTGLVGTAGYASDGINAYSYGGNVTVTSATITTGDNFADGIVAVSNNGDSTVTSTSVSTAAANAFGIVAVSEEDSAVTSGTVATIGNGSIGIYAYGGDHATVNSTSVTTAGANSGGIVVVQGDATPPPLAPPGASALSGPQGVIGVGPGVVIVSGTSTTAGANSPAVSGTSNDGFVQITSTTATTGGANSGGIVADAYTDAQVISGSVSTGGANSAGITASAYYGYVDISSTSVTTTGANSGGILGVAGGPVEGSGDVDIVSGTVSTTGVNSSGIVGIAGVGTNSTGGGVTITSTGVTTIGANSLGIGALAYGDVTIGSGSVSTQGVNSIGIYGASYYGDIAVTSGAVTTVGNGAVGIYTTAYDGNTVIGSTTISTTGTQADGILARGAGNVTVTSGTIVTAGEESSGIDVAAYGGDAVVNSTSVQTSGDYTYGIDVYTFDGNITVSSNTVVTSGYVAGGISTSSIFGDTTITSGAVTTAGDYSDGINAFSYEGNIAVTNLASVATTGYASDGIDVFAYGGNATVASNGVTTTGDMSAGIEVQALDGNVVITSVAVTTSGTASTGIYAYSDSGTVSVTATGTTRTNGQGSPAIYAYGAGDVTINSANAVTTGVSSDAIVGISNANVLITSGGVTTGATTSNGITALAAGNATVVSNGTLSTTGADSNGIRVSAGGAVSIGANNVSVTGATSDAILLTSGTSGTVSISGLVQSTNGFEVQANGGATTVSTTATGTIRGQIDLTDNADGVNNAGTFDAIGTSLFGAGTDIFANTGTTRSTNGAAVLGGLEQFNSSGLVDLRDGAVGDTLNVTGSFTGSGASHLGVDSNISNNTGDVLITGVSSGSTVLDVTLVGAPVFNLTGTLVVDATAGTSATAFALGSSSTNNPYVRLNLLFDAPNNNFLLVGLPDQPVFETAMTGELVTNFWYNSADAISAQLEAARDGLAPNAGSSAGNLSGSGRFGGWVQVLAGNTERDATQSFTGGGGTTVFDTSYEQDYQGVQGGIDYQSGGAIIGLSFGAGKSEADFVSSLNGLDIDGMNLAAYAAFTSGSFFINGLAKVDWANVESHPGGGAAVEFDATAWGLRGTAGFRLPIGGHVYLEPSVSLSWVNVDIDDYSAGGGTVAFNDITSFRGAAGVRLGGEFASGNGTFTPFVGIHAIEEFDGDARNDFTLGTTIGILQDAPGTYGEASAGLNYSTGRLEAFIRGEADFGGRRDGISGRAGVRLRF